MTQQKIQNASLSMKKGMRWALLIFLSATLLLGAMLIFILVQTTQNIDLYSPYFGWLSAINIGIAGILLLCLVWAIYRLSVRVKRGRFGSKLLMKLAIFFVLIGALPSLLVYAVSYQFVSKSIETWFDVKVEGALNAGLKLGRVSFDTQLQELTKRAQDLAEDVSIQRSEAITAIRIERARQQLEMENIILMNTNGSIITAVGPESYRLKGDVLSSAERASFAKEGYVSGIEDRGEGQLPRLWTVVHVPAGFTKLFDSPRMLRMTTLMPAAIAHNASLVEVAYKEYQERALGRQGLKQMYIRTLTLALLLAVFSAMALAITLGQQLLQPLLILVEGVRQVSEGDLSPKALIHTKDELGGLTHAFADMTTQLRKAQKVASSSMLQVAAAKMHLQTILDNLTTGVIEMGHDGVVQMLNPGAARILRQQANHLQGAKLSSVPALQELAQKAEEAFAVIPPASMQHWQETFEFYLLEKGEKTTVVARGVWLSQNVQLLVIDDISDIISAQRSVAWGEVARRLAHEIKNPLTPIQLSAERMEYKLKNKLEGEEQQILERSVKMIVEQVAAMQQLVDEFREYARLPVAELIPMDLNTTINDIVQLYHGHASGVKIVVNLEPELPFIRGDASQIRQVLHNLIQNAADAAQENANPVVQITTAHKTAKNGNKQTGWVCLTVEDNGKGFSDKILTRAFEPYITTKPKGTGLGLPVVKKIMDEHGGRINLSNQWNEAGGAVGAQVQLSFPIISSPEELEA